MDVRRAKQLYKSGLSVREVAEVLGVGRMGVYLHLLRAGVKIRPNGTAHRYPRRTHVCAVCGQQFKRSQYYSVVGGGSQAMPNPPQRRVCSRACLSRLKSQDLIERARNTKSVEIDYS